MATPTLLKHIRPPLHFPTQRPGENVVLLLRRHWSIFFNAILHLILMMILPPLALVAVWMFTDIRPEINSPLYVVLIEGLSLYYLFAFLGYFNNFVDYHLDIWLVTDQRIVSIEQVGLFRRTTAELNIMQVQDVTSEMRGKIETFLEFGNVHVQTAGEHERFVFEQVPHPERVVKIILQVHDRAIRQDELQRARDEVSMEMQMRSNPQSPSVPPHAS